MKAIAILPPTHAKGRLHSKHGIYRMKVTSPHQESALLPKHKSEVSDRI
ncbi:MAG: hypothetical protein HC852_07630 [Acaryochloridaceae cyanobacterium RU_4_10]|nr:hypothetical protein [Acaryochloridaceae cyanobacterium RU_4_10]